MSEAISRLVVLDSGATGASAIISAERTAPPKQYNIELNQQARGLSWDTVSTPEEHTHTQLHHSSLTGTLYVRHMYDMVIMWPSAGVRLQWHAQPGYVTMNEDDPLPVSRFINTHLQTQTLTFMNMQTGITWVSSETCCPRFIM